MMWREIGAGVMVKSMTLNHDPHGDGFYYNEGVIDNSRGFMVYSKRLTSLTSHLIFGFVGLTGATTIGVSWFDQPLVRFGVIPLLLLYLAVGTVGWTWTQRAGKLRPAYYAAIAALGGAIITLSTWVVRTDIAAAIIILPLAMHGAVLTWRGRLLFLSALMLGIFVSAVIIGFDLDSLLSFLAVLSGVLAFDFVGRVIVSEEAARDQLARYAGEAEELAMMRERDRLAREIHDNLGHYLTAINMQAQAAKAVMKVDASQVEGALTHIQTLAHDGLREVRNSIAAVRALPMENATLHEAIEVLVSDSRGRGLKIDYQIVGTPSPWPAEFDMTLYRMAQEALTNIHKHAQAGHVTVTMRYRDTPACIGLTICDDGVGMDAEQTTGGFGLLGLRERVRLLGGTFQLRAAQGGGVCIEVELSR